jgi:hypothetical protein
MGKVQQRLLSGACLVALFVPAPLGARKFYEDDPLQRMPKPMDVGKPAARKLSDYYDFFYMSFSKPGEKAYPSAPIPARAVNTLGEVPDNLWYTNRHGSKRMSLEELVRGPGNTSPPSTEGTWKVTGAKTEGVTPGFQITDGKGRRYQIKLDAPLNFELPTGADVMGSKFLYALGYFTPENYIVYFAPEQLEVQPGTKFVDHRGVERDMKQSDVASILESAPRDKSGRFRAVASLYLAGRPLGPFRYNGVRMDDPNDIVPHEHRRDLRGLRVFAAWLNHTDAKSLQSLDTVVAVDGVNAIRHHLLDFSAMFGTDAFEPKSPRAGNVFLVDWPDMAKTFFTFGLYIPRWTRADFEHVKGVGHIEAKVFDPARWKPHYYNPAFANCLPDDAFWAAKQVMAFTEPEIRALVGTAQYSDAAAVDYLVKVLLARQRKVGAWAFSEVLPLDRFRIENGALAFDDLGVRYGFAQQRNLQFSWATFDNDAERATPIGGSSSAQVPRSTARYLVATIHAGDPALSVDVYVRNGREVVGIERRWREMPRTGAPAATQALAR